MMQPTQQSIYPIPSTTVGQWPEMLERTPVDNERHAAELRRALELDLKKRLRPIERYGVEAAQGALAEMREVESALSELRDWLNHLQDWGSERDGISLSDWEQRDAAVDRLRESFGRILGKAQHAQRRIEDPLAALDDLERRMPPLRRPVPSYLRP